MNRSPTVAQFWGLEVPQTWSEARKVTKFGCGAAQEPDVGTADHAVRGLGGIVTRPARVEEDPGPVEPVVEVLVVEIRQDVDDPAIQGPDVGRQALRRVGRGEAAEVCPVIREA